MPTGPLHAGGVKAYVQLALAMSAKALSSKAASSKRREFNPATAKYDVRVVLLHLGLIGEEFKTARLHLTKQLAGSAAWKGERRDRRAHAGGRGRYLSPLPLRSRRGRSSSRCRQSLPWVPSFQAALKAMRTRPSGSSVRRSWASGARSR